MLKSKPFKGLAFILQSLAATLHHQLLQAMQNHSSYHLFVYGSLRQGFHHPAYQYISKYFNLVGHATTAGVLYDLGEYPAAKSSNLQSDVLHGELYAIKNVAELDWALAQLDDYEGLNPEDGPALFCRQLCTVSV
ncbi:MAG: gamma-glutamylcyclotransferase, partial [Bacteroidetes bacterium]